MAQLDSNWGIGRHWWTTVLVWLLVKVLFGRGRYYWRDGTGNGSKSAILFLEGGGWYEYL